MLVLVNGGLVFGADLLRAVTDHLPAGGEVRLDTMAVSSYEGRNSRGEVSLRCEPKLSCADREILLVDDILDTGRSLRAAVDYVAAAGAASVRSCVLFDKSSARMPGGLPAADWTGFPVPPRFVVGCGLDYNESFRGRRDLESLD